MVKLELFQLLSHYCNENTDSLKACYHDFRFLIYERKNVFKIIRVDFLVQNATHFKFKQFKV